MGKGWANSGHEYANGRTEMTLRYNPFLLSKLDLLPFLLGIQATTIVNVTMLYTTPLS